jgi:hypothetical protein
MMKCCIDPSFLDLGTSWRWMVSGIPRPVCLWYTVDMVCVRPRNGPDDMEK